MAEQNQNSLGLENTNEVENVNEFKFEPIKGYPMLNWRGKRPFTSTQYYPAQLKEVYGEEVDGWRNKIYWGDNLQVMSHLLKKFRGKVKLIYIDPPFDSNADYKKRIQLRNKVLLNDEMAFEEKQYADIWSNDEYLQFMFERLIILRELLAEDGSLFLHCDWHKAHHLRCLLDEVFGTGRIVNEIIWKRGNNKKSINKFSVAHDNIFFYSKTDKYFFKPQFEDYDVDYINSKYPNEENGRRYQLQAMYGKGDGPAMFFGDKLLSPPPGLHWRWNQERINEAMKQGIIVFPRNGQGNPRFKDFLDTKEGLPIRTIWADITEVNSQAIERETYPTQKPEELLERIIECSTSPGDLIFDAFMGSGTTQAVATKLGRRFLGADINIGAVQTTIKRLLSIDSLKHQNSLLENQIAIAGFEVYNVNNYDIFRNPLEAKELLIEALEIQKLTNNSIFDGEKDGRLVRVMPVNRICTKADLGELIAGFDYKTWQSRQIERPNQPVEKILLVCMGHEPSLKAELELAAKPFKIDVEVLDILRDKSNLEFKRDSEALVVQKNGELVIERFYPMNLLQKLSLQKETVTDWREMVESIMIDWNYDGAVLQPTIVDIPDKNALVVGRYTVPADAGTIHIKITDVLSESWEGGING